MLIVERLAQVGVQLLLLLLVLDDLMSAHHRNAGCAHRGGSARPTHKSAGYGTANASRAEHGSLVHRTFGPPQRALNGRVVFKPDRLTLHGHFGADVILRGLNIDHGIDIVRKMFKRGMPQPLGGFGVILIDRSVGKGLRLTLPRRDRCNIRPANLPRSRKCNALTAAPPAASAAGTDWRSRK